MKTATAIDKALDLSRPDGQEISAEELAEKQRTPTRGERKCFMRQVAADLADASRNTVPLSHIHPRSARRAAERELDEREAAAADTKARALALEAELERAEIEADAKAQGYWP